MKLKTNKPLIFFDLESTGTDIAKAKIVELGLVKIEVDGTRSTQTMRFNPKIPIPPETTAIHGISDADVANEPTFEDRADDLLALFSNCDLAGYNSNRFDIPLLVEEFLRVGKVFDTKDKSTIDVFRIFTKMERRDLTAAYKFYCKKELVNAHSALADIEATADILEAQIQHYDELDNSVEFLSDFSQEDHTFVDYGRRMILKDGVPVFNFGKYNGQKVVDVLEKDPSYYGWILRSDFLEHTKLKLKEIKLGAKFS